MIITFRELVEQLEHIQVATVEGSAIMIDQYRPYIRDDKGFYYESGRGGRKLSCTLDTSVEVQFKYYLGTAARLQRQQTALDTWLKQRQQTNDKLEGDL